MNLYVWCKEYLWKFLLTYYMLVKLSEQGEQVTMETSEMLWAASVDMLAMITDDPDYRSEDLFSEENDPKQLVEDSTND